MMYFLCKCRNNILQRLQRTQNWNIYTDFLFYLNKGDSICSQLWSVGRERALQFVLGIITMNLQKRGTVGIETVKT